MHKILGKRVRDKVTGFVGVATTVSQHLTGCERAWVEGPANAEGKNESCWIDLVRLDVETEGHVTLKHEEVVKSPSPSNATDPNRR